MNKTVCAGLLAHVDSGKTTLSESMLYLSGAIRKAGRVDHGDAFLDNYELEKERGITIFSKQARLSWKGLSLTLLDTPGHVDFSAEMERTLQALDYAILVISGSEGVQSHTETLWRLLKRYQIPVFLFVNKMDLSSYNKETILSMLKSRLDQNIEDFSEPDSDKFSENAAMCDEACLEQYMESGHISPELLQDAVCHRKLFPCFFGSALKSEGVSEFLDGLLAFTREPEYPAEFGARVFKISRDNQGKRLTWLKITGGTLIPKQLISKEDGDTSWQEKTDQIRLYSGSRFELAEKAPAGTVCAVTGLTRTRPGEGLGMEKASSLPILEPVITYQLLLPPDSNLHDAYLKIRQLEEESPELHIVWDESLREIHVKLMGDVQTEVFARMIKDRFGFVCEFGPGHILYKETIAAPAEGVGHFEPLRHYAEVHLLLEPGEPDSGLQFAADCSEDILARNWQRLIISNLEEKEHKGVLTGAPVTDLKITLTSGRAHLKHTEGGDFRQAACRALRQGLKKAESVLLEPYYEFTLQVPLENLGRAMTDIQNRFGTFPAPETEGDSAILHGEAPVSTLNDYFSEVNSYTGGRGQLSCIPAGYRKCHNTKEVVAAAGYDSEADLENPTGSVFCAHGAGFIVPWDEVENYMHVESQLSSGALDESDWDGHMPVAAPERAKSAVYLGTLEEDQELDAIFEREFGPVKRNLASDYYEKMPKVSAPATGKTTEDYRKKQKSATPSKDYLLVDGYNVIFSWDELNDLAKSNLDAARGKLMDILCNYQGYRGCELILVFDAYKVKGNPGEVQKYHNIHVVYTKEAETADMYIEKTTHDIGQTHRVTVATSDRLEQVIVLGEGASRISSRELKLEIEEMNHTGLTDFRQTGFQK